MPRVADIVHGGGDTCCGPGRKPRRRRAPGRGNRILFDRLAGIWGTVSCCARARLLAVPPHQMLRFSVTVTRRRRTGWVRFGVTGSPGSGARAPRKGAPCKRWFLRARDLPRAAPPWFVETRPHVGWGEKKKKRPVFVSQTRNKWRIIFIRVK